MSRESLEKAFVDAGLNLCAEICAGAFLVPVPNTTPPLYVCLGEAEQILALAGAQKHQNYLKAKAGPCRICGEPTPFRDHYMGQATWRCDGPDHIPY